MSDENEEVAMAECGSCRAIVPVDSSECPECGISFSGVSDDALGECGACNALVPLDSTKCPECGVVFVADDVIDVLRNWMANNKMDVKTLFGRFDTNDDNMIDSSELKDGLLSLNLADLPPSQVDRLIEAIDEDGDSLIDLQELQSIIGGEELEDAEEESVVEEDTEEESSLKYNENVLSKVMESSDIDESDKDAFLVFAQDFNADGNEYLKKEELQAAADAWDAQTESEEPETNSVEEELTEEEVEDEESVIEDAEEESDELDDGESDDEETDDEETTSEDPTPDELFLTLGEAIAEQGLTIREVFESMDTNLDGQISGPELQSGIEAILGDLLPPATVFAILGVLDEDDDGNIDPMELIQSIEKLDLGIESDRPTSVEEESVEEVRTSSDIIEELLSVIDAQDISLANAFGNLDDDGNRMLSKEELVSKLDAILEEGLTESEASDLIDSMDTDGDGNIDMVEFVTAIEKHEDEIATIDDEEAETVKTFPSDWQSKAMSKKWHDVFWPLIHTSFAILIVGLLVNGLFPLVDGTGGMVELDIRSDYAQTEWQMDGDIISEGEAYPCNPEIQEGECKNSLTPLAGKATSMPGGFYWDAILLMTLAGVGLIWSLYTHLILAPGWRARVKAMKDVDEERAEVQEAIDEDDSEDEEQVDEEESEEEHSEDETDEESKESEDDEFDIGSYVGLEIDGEDYYGTIIEFDDDEGSVVIEEEETGDEIVGYQDEMFIPEE
ncbi:MAG: EF-hand domain-containing protein [Candidatus Poseidoniaceae archaeon]|nr:EF-hand domain-containing protein [Candidatus Poseidoniaceae archaeon]